jgi:exodeoxyribonuclease VII large subunit
MAVHTVSQVTDYLKDSLDRDVFLADLWVSGEVSNLSRSSTGNLYFTVKDDHNQLRCVMFRPNRGGDLLDNGVNAMVHGRISLYAARGELQVYVDIAQPEGTGELYLELTRLKARLEDEGLFEPTRKRPLPSFPKKIGVVTSPTGAVFHDICTVIERRYPLSEVVLSATAVQGATAAPEIVAAIHALNDLDDIDVIIVARGGGSLEDLWAFNQEPVARAIYASRAPVVSGVGHETDTTIVDLVADLRAPTPSAAAEIVVPDATQLQGKVASFQQRSLTLITGLVSRHQMEMRTIIQQLWSHGPQIETLQQRLDELAHSLTMGLSTTVTLTRERFLGLEQRLAALNPQAVLKRGYASVQRTVDAKAVTSVAQVHSNDDLKVTVVDGTFGAKVV